jgi:phage repressor protein C with HTH and peptisase S24 domain
MLGKKIKELIAEEQQTQEQFAKSIDMSYERLRNICQGRVLKLKKEESDAIQLVYGINAQWLINDKGEKRRSPEGKQFDKNLAKVTAATEASLAASEDPKRQRSYQEAVLKDAIERLMPPEPAEQIGDYVFVKKYDIAASAGGGAVIHDESIVDHLAFKRTWVTQSLGLDPTHLALIDVRGDSMSPTIDSGDLLLLDTRKGEAMSEGVYAINLNGSLLVKRIRLKLSGAIEVCSDNPRYQTETVTAKEAERLHVVGRVVWHGGKF